MIFSTPRIIRCSLCLECDVAEPNLTMMEDVIIDSIMVLYNLTINLKFLLPTKEVQAQLGHLRNADGVRVPFEVLLDDSAEEFEGLTSADGSVLD